MSLRIIDIKDKCTACGACASVCPKDALALKPQGEIGFYFPEIDEGKCVNCHLCEKTCHVLNDSGHVDVERYPYMLKVRDRELLKKSSSGGAFSILAEKIIAEGGVVYGAAYNYEKELLEECSTEDVCLDALRKSKYIESYCGTIFRDVEIKLHEGRKVLFCGTPCQIKGLNQYLRTKRCNATKILLVQFLCHGVPSNQFFTEYKHWLEAKCRGKITDMDFRCKKYGWRTAYYYYYGNGHSKTVRGDATYYMSAFNKNYMLRDSCYGCTIFNQGYADMTIADFWGLFEYDPSNKDNTGLSLVIAHNKKSLDVVKSMNNQAELKELPLSAIDYTLRPRKNAKQQLERKRTMEQKIITEGYMPYMERILHKDVLKGQFKDIIAKILFKTRIWKISE